MYTLRKISSNGLEQNFFLGENYSIITERKSKESFNERFEIFWKDSPNPLSETIAFITNQEGKCFPIFKNDETYIMTESGKTFSKL